MQQDYSAEVKKHYYGDIVRKFFLAAALVMLITLPFLKDLLYVSVPTAIIFITALGLFGAITNPLQIWINAIDVILSFIAAIGFEYLAVGYQYIEASIPLTLLYFFTHQILAILFFLAFYFSVKTLRGKLVKEHFSSWYMFKQPQKRV